MKYKILMLIIGLMMFSCNRTSQTDDQDLQQSRGLLVKMEDYTILSSNTVNVKANVICEGDRNLMVGFIWSNNENPSFYDDDKGYWGTQEYGSNIDYEYQLKLNSQKTYYVVAYAYEVRDEIDSVYYSEQLTFNLAEFIEPDDLSVSDVEVTSARFSASINIEGDVDVIDRGFCWSTQGYPTIEDNHISAGNGTGNFTSVIEELEDYTGYYVRAYAVNSDMVVGYSTPKWFKTMHEFNIDGYRNGYAYIDLGLPSGMKWAIHNVGADAPEEYGSYFEWGQTVPDAECTTMDVEMTDFSGDERYDAARANWGDMWRMPTKEECKELINNCTWGFITYKNVLGIVVIGPNENAIFLPASSQGYNVQAGSCWSSTPYESSSPSHQNKYANTLGFEYTIYHGEYHSSFSTGMTYRTANITVRAVLE